MKGIGRSRKYWYEEIIGLVEDFKIEMFVLIFEYKRWNLEKASDFQNGINEVNRYCIVEYVINV